MNIKEHQAPERYTYPKLKWWDHLIGLTLAGIFFAILCMTMGIGFTRDEGFYFSAGRQYNNWVEEFLTNIRIGEMEESFSRENVDKHWWYNPEHPSLMKTAFGVSWYNLAVKQDIVKQSTGNRLPTVFCASLLIYLLYLFGAELFGRGPGLLACFFLTTMPRFFWHSHLSCFDVPITMAWLLVVWGYWKGMENRFMAWATGLFWGIALLIKLNAFFLPGVLGLHYLFHKGSSLTFSVTNKKIMVRLPPFPKTFISMAILGPAVFYAFWPKLWYNTFNQFAWYVGRHVGHEYYVVHYLGELFYRPPFPVEYPFLVSAVTIPVVTLAAFVIGIFYTCRRFQCLHRFSSFVGQFRKLTLPKERPLTDSTLDSVHFDPRASLSLIILAGVIPFIVIALPSVPIFGGTKHWMPGIPFLSMIAAVGLWDALCALWKFFDQFSTTNKIMTVIQPVVTAVALTVILTPNMIAVTHSHPFSVAYYNELIGGYQGAADVGMMRQFWGYTSRAGLEFVNRNAKKNAYIHFHDTNWDAFDMYKRDGLLRKDIRYTGDIRQAQYVLYHNEKEFNQLLYDIWRTYNTSSPVAVVDLDGVPLLTIYENPKFR